MRGAETSRNRAIRALRESDGDTSNAVLDICLPFEEEVGASGFAESAIKAVMREAHVGRKRAIQALRESEGDVDAAVLDMPHLVLET